MEEFNITVRAERHPRLCDCKACDERADRLIAYFTGKTEDRGVIPGSFTKGQPTKYRSKGRRIMGADLVYSRVG